MEGIFDQYFAERLRKLKESLLPFLKRVMVLQQSLTGNEISPEPDSPKDYSPGDDIRYIDWNLYARLDRYFLRNMVHEEEIPIVCLIDVSRSMEQPYKDKIELSLKLTAAITDIYLSLGHRVIIIPWADGIKEVHGPFYDESDVESIHRILQNLKCAGRTNLKKSLDELMVVRELDRFSPILVSDFLMPIDYQKELMYIASPPFGIRGVQILSQKEIDFKLRGNFILVNPETEKEIRINASYGVYKEYSKIFELHLEAVKTFFSKQGSVFFRTSAEISFEAVARDFFNRMIATTA